MNTLYHIGDIFKVKGKPALAVIVDISTTQKEQYSVTYIDSMTHNECDRDFGKNAWWTIEEIKKNFKEHRIFNKASPNKVIASKTKEKSKTSTVINSILSSVPEEKLLRRLEEIEGEFANWHISAHKSDLLYEEKADIEKELARRKTLKETSLKQSKASTPPSEPSYELVYTSYGDIGLAIDVTEDNTPIRVLTRYDSHNYDPKLEAGFSEYGGANLVHWIHTNIYLAIKDWKHISYKKSPEAILQELNINTEETYSPNLSK